MNIPWTEQDALTALQFDNDNSFGQEDVNWMLGLLQHIEIMREQKLQALVISEDWKIVPVVPTDAMALAALKASLSNPAINGTAIYAAMLSTAPAFNMENKNVSG